MCLPRRFCGYRIVFGLLFLFAQGQAAEWLPSKPEEVLAVHAVTGEALYPRVIQIANPEGVTAKDGREINEAVPLSALAGPNDEEWPGRLAWVLAATPGEPVKLRFRLGRVGVAAVVPQRLLVGWNGAVAGALFPDAAALGQRHTTEVEIVIPAEAVRAENTLWLTTGYGEIGIGAVEVEGNAGAAFRKTAGNREVQVAVATALAPVEAKGALHGTVLLLSKGVRRDTEPIRRLVLEPLGVEVEEAEIHECLPERWGAYKMVIVATWGLAPLLDEDVRAIRTYVENGGRLWINAEGFQRLSRNLPDRAEFERAFFGGLVAPLKTVEFPEVRSGYLDVQRGLSPWAARLGGEPAFLVRPGSELVTLAHCDDLNHALLTVAMPQGEPRPVSLLRPVGKGWVCLDGLQTFQPELVPLARQLVRAALNDAPIFP